jgi:DNA polymerase V
MSAQSITVFCRTSPFADKEPYYSNQASSQLSYPSDDTAVFLHQANELIQRIYKPQFRYAKAGVMLSDFYAPGTFQLGLFDEQPKDESKRKGLMSLVDQLNKQHKGQVFFGCEGIRKPWAMKRDKVSPRYTTRWDELPVVR